MQIQAFYAANAARHSVRHLCLTHFSQDMNSPLVIGRSLLRCECRALEAADSIDLLP